MRFLTLNLVVVLGCGESSPRTETRPPSSSSPAGVSTTADPSSTTTEATESWTDGVDTVEVAVLEVAGETRRYALTSSHPQRDQGPGEVSFEEVEGQPILRSGSFLFDALFALAVHETRELSVSEITDGAFDNGAPVACECFQTGAEWHYVWTRDTAYAADLGLAMVDPARTVASLEFKLSADKPAVGSGGLQIVQDTGTGGSWPVSTDRVVWAFGASRALAVLDGADRDAFRDQALEAARNTAEIDRVYVYDARDGLYRGETSFLDWREQTYPQWTAQDVRHVAESKSLSTNLGHWALLDLAARLSGEVGDAADQSRYQSWADQLAADIEDRFWWDGAYSRVLPNQLDDGPLGQRDWLATSLAALTIADPSRAVAALDAYPHGPHGPPVIWPQQPGVPIYHNRAIWPFVTAYGVRAGVKHHHEPVVQRGVDSLIRGALLNVSNMENLEVETGANWRDEGALSGPVVNSRRQLWSVAGYLSMVFDLLGVRPEADGLHVDPFIPEAVAAMWLHGDEVALRNVPWRGRAFDLVLEIPAGAGPLVARSVMVDGSVAEAPLTSLSEGAEVRVILERTASSGSLTELDPGELFAPMDPVVLSATEVGGQVELALDNRGEQGVVFDIWRDGVEVATDIPGPTWLDPASGDLGSTSYCYAVVSRYTASGLSSQRSDPVCWWGAEAERVQTFDAWALSPLGGGDWNGGADPFWNNWGAPEHTMRVFGVRPRWSGPHLVQWVHSNGSGPINTGIGVGHKWLRVLNESGAVVGEGPVVMPQSDDWSAFRDSTGVRVDLDASRTYRLELADAPNMTLLEHFSLYTGGLGGGSTAWNRSDLRGLKLLALSGVDRVPVTPLVSFDGVDDLNKLGGAQSVAVGSPLQPWESFGLTWDDENLYIAWVSQAFEEPYAPFVLYLEASVGPPGPAVPSTGFEYSTQVPELPFTPTHAVSLRNLSDDGATAGPWDGIRVPVGPDWETTRRFARGRDGWLAADLHTLSTTVPRSLLGDATHLRIVGHVVNAVPGAEWVDTLPVAHDPGLAGGGSFYALDLNGPTESSAWVQVP